MSYESFGIFFEVTTSDIYIGTPERLPTNNTLDAWGSFLDLKRLDEESNVSYYKRLMSVLPLRGGADHDGLVHGITRELGLEETIGIEITPKSDANGWIAPSPFIEVTATEIILYSSYTAEASVVDYRLDIFDHGEGYLLGDLIERINANSEYFIAVLGPLMDGEEKSNGLFPSKSSIIVEKEIVKGSRDFFLKNSDIVPGSLSFTEKSIFKWEVSPGVAEIPAEDNGFTISFSVISPVVLAGQYYVNYETGLVISKTAASGSGTCRYLYRDFPFHIRWSPVVVYSLRDEVYREKVFEEEYMPDNTIQWGVPSAEGTEIYNQIFLKAPCMWGK